MYVQIEKKITSYSLNKMLTCCPLYGSITVIYDDKKCTLRIFYSGCCLPNSVNLPQISWVYNIFFQKYEFPNVLLILITNVLNCNVQRFSLLIFVHACIVI